MEYEKIKQLMEDMNKFSIQTLDIDFPDGSKIKMEKEKNDVEIAKNIIYKDVTTNKIDTIKDEKIIEEKDENSNIITSPMVGTFYIKPAPNMDPFVEIGSKVKKGQTVCIIEAMKLMNEIESEFDGEIVEIYAQDGKPVEYGTKLFKIK